MGMLSQVVCIYKNELEWGDHIEKKRRDAERFPIRNSRKNIRDGYLVLEPFGLGRIGDHFHAGIGKNRFRGEYVDFGCHHCDVSCPDPFFEDETVPIVGSAESCADDVFRSRVCRFKLRYSGGRNLLFCRWWIGICQLYAGGCDGGDLYQHLFCLQDL